jgi:hypothetical protein
MRDEFRMPFLIGKEVPVDGLTNTQFLFSIRFIDGLGLKLITEAVRLHSHLQHLLFCSQYALWLLLQNVIKLISQVLFSFV